MRAPIRLIKPRRPRLLLGTLVLVLALVAGSIALTASGPGASLEQRTVDARFAERGPLTPPKDIVIVAIDRDQDSFGNSWPISRTLWAQAIDRLADSGVAAIAIDVPMDWKGINPTEDDDLARAVASAGVPVVFARRTAEDRLHGELGAPFAALDPTARAILPDDQPSGVSARVPAVDGAVRSYPVRGAGADRDAPGLAAALLEEAGAGDAVRRAPDELLLDWYGPRGRFEQTSFANVAYGLDTYRDLDGALVFIGPTEGIARDDHAVPVGSTMPSVEIQATAAANLLDGSWLREPATWVGPIAALAIALAVWALLLVLPLGLAVPASLAMVAGWCWLAVRLFHEGLVVPVLAPVLAGSLAFGTITLVLATLAVRERVRVKGLFARYVHADVVRELVDGDDDIRLAGEQREITVLFSDIRGFTTLSEHVDPTELVAQLNEYFEAMVDVVTRHKGSVDKFLGDGMMAIFGAPNRQDDHAERACRAAVEMLDRLEQLNRDRVARGLQELRIGIGIHTGEAVVGNVGSPPFRVDFTAIGDTVNLAARIEAMTKELGAAIVASDSTRDAVVATDADGLRFEQLGVVVARGRSATTTVHAVTADPGTGRSGSEHVEPRAA